MSECEYRYYPPDIDNHSDDLVTVYHGKVEPIVVCGFHNVSVGLPMLVARITVDRATAKAGGCTTCLRYGLWYCRETSDTCDHCGHFADVLMDYAQSGDRENPDQTLCLDCINDRGQHIKAAHPTQKEPAHE